VSATQAAAPLSHSIALWYFFVNKWIVRLPEASWLTFLFSGKHSFGRAITACAGMDNSFARLGFHRDAEVAINAQIKYASV
jgi:hypothetical protein